MQVLSCEHTRVAGRFYTWFFRIAGECQGWVGLCKAEPVRCIKPAIAKKYLIVRTLDLRGGLVLSFQRDLLTSPIYSDPFLLVTFRSSLLLFFAALGGRGGRQEGTQTKWNPRKQSGPLFFFSYSPGEQQTLFIFRFNLFVFKRGRR